MSLFKNEIGRPPNEILNKRRNIKLIIAIAVIAVVASVSYLTYSFVSKSNVSGASKNIVASGANLYISGNKGFIINGSYKSGYVSLGSSSSAAKLTDSVGSSVVYTNTTDSSTIGLKGVFGKEFTKKINGQTSKMIIQSFNSSGNQLSSKTVDITKSTMTGTLSISKDVRSIKVSVMKVTVNGVSQAFSKTVKISTLPNASASFVDQTTKNSSGQYVVSKNGTNRIKFNLTTNSTENMYYSVYSFKSHTINSSNLSKREASCVAFNKNTTTSTYSITVKEPVAVSVRIYYDKNTCNNDAKIRYSYNSSKSASIAKELVIKYLPKYTTTNSHNYTVINPHYATEISKTIGHQSSAACLEYALKYGAYILKGSVSSGTGTVAANYGATKSKYKTEAEFYKLIINKINAGIPVILHTGNASSATHWVTVIGYRTDSKGETNIDMLWIIDPWNDNRYNEKSETAVFFGESKATYDVPNPRRSGSYLNKKGQKRTTMTKGLNSDKIYYTWSSRASVK